MRVDFRILGPLEVSRDGRPVAVGGQRQKALLCLLLLHANEVVSADRLVDELWRGAPSATAGKALQVYVSRLRKALGADALETRAPGYRIRIEDGALDLWRFERLAGEGTHALAAGDPARASASLQKALALWRGPAIADVMYEPFAQAEAARLEELRLSCLEDRLEADLALGHHAGVVGELEALVDRHRSRERLRGQLMLALYRSGRQAEALEIYRETRRTLVEELGIQPGPELQSLEREILNQDPRLTWMPPHITAAKPSRPAGVFVGREHELAEFVGALGDLEHGRGSLFLVSGEPGIGKSRLAEEAAALAAERGARVLSGRAWEFGGAPAYWPWVQCLRALVRDADPATLTAQLGAGAADVAQVLPELGESFPDLSPAPSADPEGARFRLFDAVATFVRNAARAKPMVLVLEDLHAADAPSLLLLQFVAAELADARVLVIATWRDGDRAANAAFGPILAALARNERFHQMALGGLRPEEVTRLVEVTGGIEASEEVVAAIHARTDGHPFFVTELARLLASRGRHDGLPRGVRAVVAQRLGLLSEDCRRVLAVASVVGREFRADVLATASELDGAALLDLLSEAVAAKSLLELPGASGRFRVAHALVAEVLYDELAPDRRIRLHRQVGEALEAIHAAEPEQHLAELARHFAAAAPIGTVPQAVDYATRAAERATRELAYEEAARLYELALVAHELAPGADTAARCNLLLALGDMQARANDMVSAKETFLRAADVARGSGMADRLADAALGYGGRFVMLPEDDPRIVPLLEEALAALGDDEGALRARLLARLSCARNNPPRSLEAVELARRVGDPATLVSALEARSVLLWGLDNLDEMLDLSEEVIALAGGAQAWESALNTHLQRQELLLTLGRTQEARADVDAAARLASELRLPSAHWHVAVHEVELALLGGRFAEAQALIDTARRLGEQASTDEVTINAVTQRFALLRERGGLDELRPALQRIAADYPDEAVYRCLLARLEWDTGHEDEARAMFELLARDRCAAVHRGLEWLLAITLLAEMAVDLEGVAHAEMLYELLTPYPSLVTVGPHFFHMGSTARALGILAALLSRPDEAIRHLEAAAAINERIGARPWVAHTKADHARVLLTRGAPGDPDRADDLLRHALAVYRELGMTASEHKLSSLLGDPTVV